MTKENEPKYVFRSIILTNKPSSVLYGQSGTIAFSAKYDEALKIWYQGDQKPLYMLIEPDTLQTSSYGVV